MQMFIEAKTFVDSFINIKILKHKFNIYFVVRVYLLIEFVTFNAYAIIKDIITVLLRS